MSEFEQSMQNKIALIFCVCYGDTYLFMIFLWADTWIHSMRGKSRIYITDLWFSMEFCFLMKYFPVNTCFGKTGNSRPHVWAGDAASLCAEIRHQDSVSARQTEQHTWHMARQSPVVSWSSVRWEATRHSHPQTPSRSRTAMGCARTNMWLLPYSLTAHVYCRDTHSLRTSQHALTHTHIECA